MYTSLRPLCLQILAYSDVFGKKSASGRGLYPSVRDSSCLSFSDHHIISSSSCSGNMDVSKHLLSIFYRFPEQHKKYAAYRILWKNRIKGKIRGEK